MIRLSLAYFVARSPGHKDEIADALPEIAAATCTNRERRWRRRRDDWIGIAGLRD
ncbi:hypothetical protein KY284_024465 [Solanum tuberosum]|nr:hypothetical protein KY284_024465 [Solanum tuberosum]